MKDWTLLDDARLLSLLSKGWTRKQIAADFGVTRNAICGRVHRLAYKPPKEPIAMPDEEATSPAIALNPIMAPSLPALPPPVLVISTSADHLDEWAAKEGKQPYKGQKRRSHPGDYVGWIGLLATTCGKVISVDQRNNRAVVEWYDVDKIFCKLPPSSLCRWTDLYPAYPFLVERVAALRGS